MKQFLHITLAVVLLSTAMIATAQNTDKKQHRQWTKEMLDYKHDFIAEQTDMSPAQRDKFMPLYEAMEKEIYNLNHNARVQARKLADAKTKATDQEYFNTAKAMSQVKVKEGEIESKYFDKFAKILSKKQMFQLKQAEIQFSRQMLSKGKKK